MMSERGTKRSFCELWSWPLGSENARSGFGPLIKTSVQCVNKAIGVFDPQNRGVK